MTTDQDYKKQTPLLDFQHPVIQKLIEDKQWHNLNDQQKILTIYNFVRDEIKFGFNAQDTTKASEVITEGYGQCNTKGILFMALLRAVGISCRLHGFTIDKSLQSGIMQGPLFEMMPKEIVHTWVEVLFNNHWYNMEGLILDLPYLNGVQQKFTDTKGSFSGYGVATEDLKNPNIYWNGENHTYIQKEGIIKDFGVFTDPDSFFAQHSQQLDPEQMTLFANKLRHEVNNKISEIRDKD